MKRLALEVAILFGWALTAYPGTPATLTSLRDIHALTNAQASHHPPVDFEGTVTYSRDYEHALFVQDGEFAVYVRPPSPMTLVPGDRVHIKGIAQDSFRPSVKADSITVIGRAPLPKPVAATFDDLIRARYDCRLVTIRGVIRTADVMDPRMHKSILMMVVDGGDIQLALDTSDLNALRSLLDAEVEVTGDASGMFDGKMQQTGVHIRVASFSDIKVLHLAHASPWDLAVTPMDEIITAYHVNNLTPRVRVRGTVTYYQPGSAVVLQDGKRSLWIMTKGSDDLRIGDIADATGIPGLHDGFLALTRGEIQDSHVFAPVSPSLSNWTDLTKSRNIFDLVTIQGQVVMKVREAAQDEYVLLSDGQLFTAILRHPASTYSDLSPPSLPPMKEIPLGSKVQVTGICILEDSNPFDAQVPFEILMRNFDDVAVVAPPSPLNTRNLLILIGVLLIFLFAAGVRGWALERKVRRQTAALARRIEAEAALQRRMAQLEKRRSQILEDINGSEPLAEILEQIVQLVSFGLDGAKCWCEINDGASLGKSPADAAAHRIVKEPILARTGAPIGTLYAAFDPATSPSVAEADALSAGSRLATLAIETRRLYSDLLHRSEFDMLTDIHNRFALDKHLKVLIDKARKNASIFGLIYIDLDGFKQVNDLYGHQVGDLYLQEVAARMKHQLRSHDTLARLGGDEFAALVDVVPNRAGVEEIATRLERCFDDPFAVEGFTLRGSASIGIALYPEDAKTKDDLLSSADAAMYVMKQTKAQVQTLS